jgi:hypothetical protein
MNPISTTATGRPGGDPRDDGNPQAGRRPEWVVVTWVSEQLRDRVQRNGRALAEALQTGTTPDSSSDPDLADPAGAG